MLNEETLKSLVTKALTGVDIPELGEKTQGKVRDIYQRDNQLILITTDRLSAFDRVLGTIPYKGQVLNQLSAFWFEQTVDVIGNHVINLPDPNVTVAHQCEALPVEVIVRGYITGVTKTALWYRYRFGRAGNLRPPFPRWPAKKSAAAGSHHHPHHQRRRPPATMNALPVPKLWKKACSTLRRGTKYRLLRWKFFDVGRKSPPRPG